MDLADPFVYTQVVTLDPSPPVPEFRPSGVSPGSTVGFVRRCQTCHKFLSSKDPHPSCASCVHPCTL